MDVDDIDVFLNHRGPDVKLGFVSYLYRALRDEGLTTFLDARSLEMGSHAFETIDAAVKAAKVHVAVVSPRYAESKYCLTELVAMLRSENPVIPVFYDVGPEELRRVETGAFAPAFQKHRSRQTEEKVREWADALRKLASITGTVFHASDGNVVELQQLVVDAVIGLLPRPRPLQVENHLVGLDGHLKTCVRAVMDMSDARCVLGLVGVGGVGKSSLAKLVYNQLIGHGKFDEWSMTEGRRRAVTFKAACFLEIGQNVRSSEDLGSERLKGLQMQLLWDLLRLGDRTARRGARTYVYWFRKLSRLGPVLIGLDGIRDKYEFDKLIPMADALAPGSCIIATSRDRHLVQLIAGTAKLYVHEVTPLSSEDSQKLFNWHAFRDDEAPANFKDLSTNVSKVYGGLPLALKVVGRSLCGKTSDYHCEHIWPEAMKALGHQDIRSALKWSYDHLSKPEKLMFVDIACLFCGWKRDKALQILQSCTNCSSCCRNTSPYASFENLMDKSLFTLDDDVINMHNLVQELGQHIGEDEGSHLRTGKAMKAVKCEMHNTHRVRALIIADIGGNCKLDVEIFAKMPNLHFLVLNGCVLQGNFEHIFTEVRYLKINNVQYLRLECATLKRKRLPRMPELSNLVSLDMSESSKLAATWIGSRPTSKEYPNLVSLNLSKCNSIITLSDFICRLSTLQVLNLTDCGKLQKVPDSIRHLTSLQELLLCGCESLEALPNFITHLRDFKRLYKYDFSETWFQSHWYIGAFLDWYISDHHQAITLQNVQTNETVVLGGFVDEECSRECSRECSVNVFVSTNQSATLHMLSSICESFRVREFFLEHRISIDTYDDPHRLMAPQEYESMLGLVETFRWPGLNL